MANKGMIIRVRRGGSRTIEPPKREDFPIVKDETKQTKQAKQTKQTK